MLQASPDRISDDLNVLARDIGVRLAGTAGERAAADHVLARARAIGAEAWDETFPMRARAVSDEQLQIEIGGAWHPFACSLFSSTPGTNGDWCSGELTR